MKRDIKDWATIHKGLGNQNRLRILQLLNETEKMSVTDLAEELEISFKNTSRNLSILRNLSLVETFCAIVSAFLLFVNGQYYMQRVVGNAYKKDEGLNKRGC